MELVVDRRWKKDTYTIGIFYINGVRFSETMEDRDRGLVQTMPLSEIKSKKVYGETAIPSGRYKVMLTHSPKFASREWAKLTNGKVPEIMNVPGYSGVRIHPFNTAKDSLGCIGLGKNDKKGWISQSTIHYKKFVNDYLLPAWEKGEDIFITIK